MKKYYVVLTSKKNDDETILLKTESIETAKERAKEEAYYISRDDRKNDSVEIRDYVEDIESDSCDCFDYNTINF